MEQKCQSRHYNHKNTQFHSREPGPFPSDLENRANSLIIYPLPPPLRLPGILLHLRRNKLRLLIVNALLPTIHIRRLGPHHLRLHNELVAQDHDDVERDAEVVRDEGRVVEAASGEPDAEAFEDGDQAAEEESAVGAGFAEGGFVSERAVRDALRAAGVDEEDVGDKNGDPGEETEHGN